MPINKVYKHLGRYSDWVDFAKKQMELFPEPQSDIDTRLKLKDLLGFTNGPEIPLDIKVETHWEQEGIIGESVSWWVGYGPRTESWLFYPANIKQPIPGILALHDHGGFKYFGKEKIAKGPQPVSTNQLAWWKDAYGNRPFVNELARAGFAVLVHDTFLWGSRRFSLDDMPDINRWQGAAAVAAREKEGELLDEIGLYNAITGYHEHTVEKYCNLLGTTLAGVVSHEDRIALNYLATRPEIISDKLGCIGLSGGGNRSALLLATSEKIQAAVIVGLMSTYEGLLDHNVVSHTWMFFPSGWAKFGDWPDIAASRAPMPLLVQYDIDDELFTMDGMQNSNEKIKKIYQRSENPDAYSGRFYPGPHKFDANMQKEAFEWLVNALS